MSEISPKIGLLSEDELAKQPSASSKQGEATPDAGNDLTENTRRTDKLSYGSVTFDDSTSGSRCGTPLFVVWLTVVAACGSFLFGYDTGVVSGAMLYLRQEFTLTDVQQEAVVSVTIAAAAVSSLLGAWLNHSIGRRPTIIVSSIVFTAGAAVLGFAVNLAMLIIGRLVVGVGIGLASMTVPVYIAECSPPSRRGSLVTVHQFMITFGMLAANVFAGAFSYVDEGWRYMLGLAGVPSLLQLFALVCLPESPRWLVKAGRMEDAERALVRMRERPDVTAELVSIKETCNKEAVKTSLFEIVRRMFTDRLVRRALVIGCGLQMFQQLAGINTVMYYTATIMKMSGVRDNTLAIWLSCAVAGTNVLMTMVAMYLIDRLGRKPLVVVSFLGVLVSLVTLAVGFQLAASHSPSVTVVTSGTQCSGFSDCDECVSDGGCGFCFFDTNGSVSEASCLVSAGEYSDHSATGDCSRTAEAGAIWGYDFCPSQYALVTLIGMVMYIVAFAPGLAPVPWTMNAEIYPLWARSTGNALSTATNWTFNLLVAMTFLTLTSELTKYGTYWLYSGVAVLGVLFVTFLVPETRGRSLEQMETLLLGSWVVWPPT